MNAGIAQTWPSCSSECAFWHEGAVVCWRCKHPVARLLGAQTEAQAGVQHTELQGEIQQRIALS